MFNPHRYCQPKSNDTRTLTGIALMLAVVLAGAQTVTNHLSFRTLEHNGMTLKNARIGSVTATHANVHFDGGIAKVPLKNLPDYAQKHYGYDPEAAGKRPNALAGVAWTETNAPVVLTFETNAPGMTDAKRKLVLELNKWFSVKFDRFKNTTSIITRQSDEVNFGALSFGASAHLIGTNAPRTVFISCDRVGDTWRLLKYRDVVVLYDGAKAEFKKLDHHGEVFSSGDVFESLSVPFNLQEFKSIAFATNAEMRIGILPAVEFTYQARTSWRVLAQYLEMISIERGRPLGLTIGDR